MGELGIAIVAALNCIVVQPQEATILFAGDAMMHQLQIDVAKQSDGTYDYSGYFDAVAPLVSQADYAVVNLETPVSQGRYSGYPMFNAPDSYVDELKKTGFDLMLTANNHTLDRSDQGLVRTIQLLDAKGLDHIGTYTNQQERAQALPFVKDINGFQVGFLNYTYGTNGLDVKGDAVVDYIDRSLMKKDIAALRDAGAELVCVAVHWGVEYKLLPNAAQKSLADFLMAQGADMVIGGHPHVIQPMEMRTGLDGKKKFLTYSLGNFISNMKTRDTRGGAIARVHLKRDDNGNATIHAADYDLVFTMPGTKGGDNFRLVYADSCSDSRHLSNCKAFAVTARSVFDTHNIDVPHR